MAKEQKEICGIIMPISAIDNCNESHWADVLEILQETIDASGFVANLVSNADDVGIIQKRIIQNIYENPIVVCDVSGKNPNVMFELGMRLAFDKPTIIIKDDKTSYSFDTSPIEHLEYPRDLRFSKIVEFKDKLSEKIMATYDKSINDKSYTTFLKHFGEFTVAKIDKKEVSGQEYIIDELRSLRSSIRNMELNQMRSVRERMRSNFDGDIDICMGSLDEDDIKKAINSATSHPDVKKIFVEDRGKNHKHLIVDVKPGANLEEIENLVGGRRARRRRAGKPSANAS